MKTGTRANILWLACYAAVVSGIVWGMLRARTAAVQSWGSPAAQAEWQQWRDEATKQSGSAGPVRRRIPQSGEPPALVLLRDHFTACTVMAVTLSSALFGTLMFLLRGALQTAPVETLEDETSRPRNSGIHSQRSGLQ